MRPEPGGCGGEEKGAVAGDPSSQNRDLGHPKSHPFRTERGMNGAPEMICAWTTCRGQYTYRVPHWKEFL